MHFDHAMPPSRQSLMCAAVCVAKNSLKFFCQLYNKVYLSKFFTAKVFFHTVVNNQVSHHFR